MKLNLATRLFAAVLSAAVVVAVAMGVGAHVNLNRDFLGYLNEQSVGRLDLAVPSVTAGYRQQGSWDFLRERPDLWYRLLRPAPDDNRVPLSARPPASATPAELTGASRRFTLLDAERRRIVGFASPAENAVERAIVVDGVTVGWLVLTPFESVSYGAEKRFADAQARTGWVVGGGAVLLAAAVALWASRRLLRPVRQVADATHRLAAGDHATRVPQNDKDDEIGRLARDFNQLALTLQRNEAMRREFMADVSHELRTPLGVLHGELEALEDGVRQLDATALRSLKAEVATLHKLVDDLYELSLADVGALSYRKSALDLREIIDDTAGAFGERLRSSGLALQLELPPGPLPAFGDARRLRQLFANLLENSCRYTDAGGALRLKARREGRQVLIDLHDSAPGVHPDQLPRLFERFFRVEASRSRASGGAGLGLSICQRIVQAHEGRIDARPSPLGGLWLRVELPALG
ncbi:histidine kinase [beta proteobacterium AAP121]|nr:histidine kinase [beta proteobacterium AAP65]KPF96582.1 histidine kinase [beta proteobacterium AAP121]